MALKHAVEYAKSDRAECKLCGKKITKGAVRLDSIVPVKGYYSTKWHHPDCYLTTDSNAAAMASDVDADKLEGFPTLKLSDQAALKALSLGFLALPKLQFLVEFCICTSICCSVLAGNIRV